MRTPLKRFRTTASSTELTSSPPTAAGTRRASLGPRRATLGPRRSTPGQRRFRWIRGRRYIEGTTLIGPKDATGDQFLDFQHFIVRRILGGNHQSPLLAPQRILDAGCGTGRWVVEMATEFPWAEVVGLDLVRPDNLAPMLAPLGSLAEKASFVEADLRQPLPFPDAHFDFAHMRLMYDDLPTEQYLFALRELVRVTRLGGWVECAEPCEAIYHAGPAYQLLSQWSAALCRRRGVDPDLGPKLQQLLRLAGVPQVTVRVARSFPDLAMTRERRLWQAQAIGAFESIFREPILEAGVATAEEFDHTLMAARFEFEAGRYANSDVLYVAYGQR
jgi:ubiquinone/menaquinone biosynthesis C-methylase UbiE